MRLEDIIRDCGAVEVKGSLGLDITKVCDDSREVKEGSLFVAVKGHGTDGHAYIGKAIEPRPLYMRTIVNLSEAKDLM